MTVVYICLKTTVIYTTSTNKKSFWLKVGHLDFCGILQDKKYRPASPIVYVGKDLQDHFFQLSTSPNHSPTRLQQQQSKLHLRLYTSLF